MSYTFRIWIFALIALWTVGSAGFAQAQNYVFNSFQVEGNARIQSSTVLSYAGIEPGTSISAGQLNDAYRRVVDSGIFETVTR